MLLRSKRVAPAGARCMGLQLCSKCFGLETRSLWLCSHGAGGLSAPLAASAIIGSTPLLCAIDWAGG